MQRKSLRPMRARVWCASALAAALSLTACSSARPPEALRAQELHDFLSRRAGSLAAGDVEGFLDPLTHKARAVEEPIARGATKVPLAHIDLEANARPARESRNGRVLRGLPVTFEYRYKGLPAENVFRFNLRYDLKRHKGSWRVTKVALAKKQALPAWATGPVSIARSEHFVAMFRPGLNNVDELLDIAERARAGLVDRLMVEPDPRNLVLFARDHRQFKSMTGHRPDIGALAETGYYFLGDRAPLGRQMVVDLNAVFGPASTTTAGEFGVDVTPTDVFQHELAHLALSRFTYRSTPGWVIEGAAMYLSGERREQEWKDSIRLDLMDLSSIRRFSYFANCPDYSYCNAAVLYLVEAFGPERFFRFYKAFGEHPSHHPGFATRTLLRRFYDLTAAQLDVRTKEFIEQQALGT